MMMPALAAKSPKPAKPARGGAVRARRRRGADYTGQSLIKLWVIFSGCGIFLATTLYHIDTYRAEAERLRPFRPDSFLG
jgi:hypothetical protein